ncbi:pyridoxine 5'-phosphate synthase [Ahniella affigens]|uniref:Pyridoxine 5'-phosphate synthase n=1 Tax=Ahniella affigens TaxID=2021234 RepID=A0A2P1PW64_9GAMM|nr:pyridoxine 5'-phosphate synthase [Ahniella affigens]AVP99079.1 pyridoxine 5'-phosphate synthase [Ahniella affigens]
MPAKLSVNVNKVAVLRNSRGGRLPSVVAAATVAIQAGAAGITVHPRPDLRHIRPDDVRALKAMLPAGVEFNIEGNPFAPPNTRGYPGLLALAAETLPDQITLVPDSDDQITSDHGFSIKRDAGRLQPVIAAFKALGCRVSLFMDADSEEIADVAALGADRIEIYTGPYAEAFGRKDYGKALADCVAAGQAAAAAGLGVNAGHDLDTENLRVLARALPMLAEVSIGHALFNDALYAGLDQTVKQYLQALQH